MHDARIHMLSDIVSIRAMQRDAAHMALMESRKRQSEAEGASAAALERVAEAADQWREQLSSTFAPEIAGLLAQQLIASESAATLTHEEAGRALDAASEAEQEWHVCDARSRVAEDLLASARRDRSRDMAMRALETTADRATLHWRGR